MVFAILTLTTSLILNFAVLALLKIGLRNGRTARDWAAGQPC
jgi:hypothetical protein